MRTLEKAFTDFSGTVERFCRTLFGDKSNAGNRP
jgi:hypothetical protein